MSFGANSSHHLCHLIDGADAQHRHVELHLDRLLAEPRPHLAVVPRPEEHVERRRDRLCQLLSRAAHLETARDTAGFVIRWEK